MLGERSAHLSFLLPAGNIQADLLGVLLDELVHHAGDCGALKVLADIEEHSPVFESLRRAGFSVYAWQQIFRLSDPAGEGHNGISPWKAAAPEDENAIRSLYQSLVPPLVQGAELPTLHRQQSLVYHQDGELLACVGGIYGPHGIYLQPLFHPAVEKPDLLLKALIHQASPLLGRPLYVAVRSYQGWLQNALQDLQCEAAPRQALLVKHLAAYQRAPLPNARLAGEKTWANPSAPIVNHPPLKPNAIEETFVQTEEIYSQTIYN